jgi:hypothetical protein
VEIGASLEAIHLSPRSHKGVLNQIIRIIPVSAQWHGKGTKGQDGGTKLVSGDGGSGHLGNSRLSSNKNR